jgi:hypothetical protein
MRFLVAKHPAQAEISQLAGEAAPVVAGALEHHIGRLQVAVNLQRVGRQAQRQDRGEQAVRAHGQGRRECGTQAGRKAGGRFEIEV